MMKFSGPLRALSTRRTPADDDGTDDLQIRLRQARRNARALRQELKATRRQLRDARQQIREGTVPTPEHVERVIDQVRQENLTFLRKPNLRDLAAVVTDLE
ncbi:MAG: hypothetical protein ACRDOM_07375, partial [Nocardioides sp.]